MPEIKVRISLPLEAHGYYHELIVMREELLNQGYSEPFRVRTNLQLPHDAEKGVHLFTEYTPFTEKSYILKQDWVLDWVIDRELEEDILILETVSKEAFLKWCEVQITSKNDTIRRILKEIEDLVKYRYMLYGGFE